MNEVLKKKTTDNHQQPSAPNLMLSKFQCVHNVKLAINLVSKLYFESALRSSKNWTEHKTTKQPTYKICRYKLINFVF